MKPGKGRQQARQGKGQAKKAGGYGRAQAPGYGFHGREKKPPTANGTIFHVARQDEPLECPADENPSQNTKQMDQKA